MAAGDLKTEQEANRQQHEQLGQAIGAGVVQGLEVTLVSTGADRQAPVVSITSGLALNGLGQAVALPLDLEVVLEPPSQGFAPKVVGEFQECLPVKKGDALINAGIYILVVSPVPPGCGFKEKAPMMGLINREAIGCGARYTVEGVRFRLEELPLSSLTGLSQSTRDALAARMTKDDAATLSKLRNWLAHVCLGTEELARFAAAPFARTRAQGSSVSSYLNYGALDALSGKLTSGDVPLALLYWTKQGVQFLDLWSVRRRPTPPTVSNTWPLPLSPRRSLEAEAAWLQFQAQVDDLWRSKLSNGELYALKASDYFRYLPAAGFLPLAGKGARGLNLLNFAAGLTIRNREALQALSFPDRFYIEGARLERLLRDSLAYPPIDLNQGELIWFYLVRENIQAVDGAGLNPPQPYLVFANGQMPFLGEARFDLNRWGYSHYS